MGTQQYVRLHAMDGRGLVAPTPALHTLVLLSAWPGKVPDTVSTMTSDSWCRGSFNEVAKRAQKHGLSQ
jgi:hypothetical protein